MKRLVRTILLVLSFVLPNGAAQAHLSSDSYLRLDISDSGITGQWDIALRDLDVAVGLDANGDGTITWGELRVRRREIEAYALSRLTIALGSAARGGGACRIEPQELLVDHHAGGGYAVLRFAVVCPQATAGRGDLFTLRYRLLFDLDPTHRGLLTVNDHGAVHTAVLAPDRADFTLVTYSAATSGFLAFLRLGAEHIVGGRDHLLFIAVLLAPALAQAYRGGIRRSLFEAAGLLSLFTAAHGVTVTLAALGVLDIPGKLIEAAIAFSIALTAADNLRPFLGGRRGGIAFGFGLIHGLGFASALGPLALTGWSFAAALIGFNLGIELVQIGLAALAFGLLWGVRRWSPSTRRPLPSIPVASFVIFCLASYWFVDRAFL